MGIILAILLFSLLIFLHELGHFVTAKLSGVQVNEFSMFMGPAIVKWQRGETLYTIRCIPFGGYCAMEGEDGDSNNPRSFGNAAWWKRLIILLAGAAMNLLTGFLLFAICFAPAEGFVTPVIEQVQPECTIVGEAGFQLGDRILEVDGEKVYTANDFSLILVVNSQQPKDGNEDEFVPEYHDFVVERQGSIVTLNDVKMEKHPFTQENGKQVLLYGFSFGVEEANFASVMRNSWNSTLSSIQNVRLSLGMLLAGKADLDDMMGPIGVGHQMSKVVDTAPSILDALVNLLYLGAFFSVNLCVMNLLPIPALDGGRAVCLVLTTAVEKISGKKLNPKYEAYLHGAGLIILLLLMVIIAFKDIFTIFA